MYTLNQYKNPFPACECSRPADVLLKKDASLTATNRTQIAGLCYACYEKHKHRYEGYEVQYMKDNIIKLLQLYMVEFIRHGHNKDKLLDLWNEALVMSIHKE